MVNLEIEELKKNYIFLSKFSIKKTQDFLKNLSVKNKETGEIFPVTFDPLLNKKNDYLNFLNRSKIIQDEAMKAQKQAFFITATLPSPFHKFKKNRDGNLIKNEQFNPKLTNEDGYTLLKEFFRAVQKDFFDKELNKKITFKFVKVIEPHKDFTPHMHGLVYVPKIYIEKFKEHVKNLLGCFVIEKYENKTIYIKNNNMGRSEIEQISDATRANAYLLKYISKSVKFDKIDENFHVQNGWKKAHKIRNFTTSTVSISRYVFNTVYKKAWHLLDKNLISNDLNMLQLIEQKTHAKIEIFDSENWEIKTKIKGNADKKAEDTINVYIRFIKFSGENAKGETVTKYKKTRTLITFKNKKVFDSDDFELIE